MTSLVHKGAWCLCKPVSTMYLYLGKSFPKSPSGLSGGNSPSARSCSRTRSSVFRASGRAQSDLPRTYIPYHTIPLHITLQITHYTLHFTLYITYIHTYLLYITLHYIALHTYIHTYIHTLHYITFIHYIHYIHYTTLYYSTLHYIALLHTYIHTYHYITLQTIT